MICKLSTGEDCDLYLVDLMYSGHPGVAAASIDLWDLELDVRSPREAPVIQIFGLERTRNGEACLADLR